eukprot:2747301-Amphidinium_carterae.3
MPFAQGTTAQMSNANNANRKQQMQTTIKPSFYYTNIHGLSHMHKPAALHAEQAVAPQISAQQI